MPKKVKRGRGKRKIGKLTDYYDEHDSSLKFAQVDKRLGGQFINVFCSDMVYRKMYICGKIKTKIWLNEGDILYISLRTEFTDTDNQKCDYLHKLDQREITNMRRLGKLDFIKDEDENEGDEIIFEEEDEENKEEDNYRDNLMTERVMSNGLVYTDYMMEESVKVKSSNGPAIDRKLDIDNI